MWLLGWKGTFDARVTIIYGFHTYVNEQFGLLLDTKVETSWGELVMGPLQGASQLQHRDNFND
jgi:hypothetical protein